MGDTPSRVRVLPKKIATGAAAPVALAGSVIGLLFALAPRLRPCFGSSASFISAPVFPGVHFRDHLIREGATFTEARHETDPIGAEIRFDFDVSGYRGKRLPITWSLFRVDNRGSVADVVPGQDRAAAMIVQPQTCSDRSGYDLWIPIPDRHKRYRALLELYNDPSLDTRIDLIETQTFRR